MGTYAKELLIQIREGTSKLIRAYWTDNPNEMALLSLIVCIAQLLHTSFYVDRGDKFVYSDAKLASSKVHEKYSVIVAKLLRFRNIACHALGSTKYDEGKAWILKHWKDVKEMLKYLDVLDEGSYSVLGSDIKLLHDAGLNSVQTEEDVESLLKDSGYSTVKEYLKHINP